MDVLYWLAAVAVVLVFVGYALKSANELFRIETAKGSAKFVSGRIPPELLREIGDVVRRAKLDGVVIRGVVESGRPRIRIDGEIKKATHQQLRNVTGRFEVAQIRAGKRPT